MKTWLMMCSLIAAGCAITDETEVVTRELGATVPPALQALQRSDAAPIRVLRGRGANELRQVAAALRGPGAVEPTTKNLGALNAWIDQVLDAIASDRAGTPAARKIAPPEQVDDTMWAVDVIQMHAGLRVLDRNMIVQILADGTIEGVSGPIADVSRVVMAPPRTSTEVLAAAQAAYPDIAIKGSIATRAIDVSRNASVWTVVSTVGEVRLDERTLAIYAVSQPHDDFYEGARCHVRHPRHIKDDDGATLDMFDTDGFVNDRISKCGRENIGICRYELSYHPSGKRNPLGRVLDDDATELTDVDSGCGIGGFFEGTSAAAQRQQSVFYYQERARSFLEDNMWSRKRQQRSADVQFVIDDFANFGLTPGHFDRNTTDITIAQDVAEDPRRVVNVVWHEYGHYVNWTYGTFSYWCTPNEDEGNPVNETFANLAAMLVLADDPEINVRYNTRGILHPQFAKRHVSGETIEKYAPDMCRRNVDPHFIGRGLEVAMWEILWNRDCEPDGACGSSSSITGDDLWASGTIRDRIISNVGRAIARAQRVTTENVTFDDVLFWFDDTIGDEHGSAVQLRIRDVLIHHGFNP